MKRLTFILLFLPVIAFSQTQDDFTNEYARAFQLTDTAEIRELADGLYTMLEENEALQNLANYYTLRVIYLSLLQDEKQARAMEKRGNSFLEVSTTSMDKPESYENPELEWSMEYFQEFSKRSDIAFGKKAANFIEKNPSVKSFGNYSHLANYFEKAGDFGLADEYYNLAFTNIDLDKDAFISIVQPAFFYLKSGQYDKVEECLALNKQLIESTDNQYILPGLETQDYTVRMYYFLYVGDYFNYIKSSNAYYSSQIKTQTDEKYVTVYQSTMKMNEALGFEVLRKFEEAEESSREAQVLYNKWVDMFREEYPRIRMEYVMILDPYLARIGKLKVSDDHIKELDNYYDYTESSAQPDNVQNYYKAINYALYRSPRYHQMFETVIEGTKKTRDFFVSSEPIARYGYFLMRDGQFNESEKTYDELFKVNIDWINDLIFTFGEKNFVTYFNTKLKNGYQDYHSFVMVAKQNNLSSFPKLAGQSYDNLLLTKSIGFKGVRKRKKAFLQSNSPEVIALYNEWLEKKKELIRLYQQSQLEKQNLSNSVNTPGNETQKGTKKGLSQDSLESKQQELDILETDLASKSEGFQETLKIDAPKWQSVRNNLKPGEAAIEMIRFHYKNKVFYSDTSYYAAYIVKHDSKYPEVVYLPSFADDLDGKFYQRYNNSIRLKIEDNSSYNEYWKPIGEALEDVNKVYFSPDGIYHLINLPTLKNPATGKFLIDEIDIQNVTSSAEIGSTASNKSISEAVLVGRPSYSLGSNQVDKEAMQTRAFTRNFREANIADLPGTEIEVRTIKQELEKEGITVREFLGKEATEEKLVGLQNPDILHVATHGFWSGLEDATPGYRMFNAMVNSGLLLAGVVDYYTADDASGGHDGILTAFEAQEMNLEGTSLVILSACETGLGDFDAGEGVYGLQRAFRAAGSESIMTSLWKVDDQGTKDFMIAFYKNWLQLGDKFKAYRQAQLDIKAKYKDPYYWGAFVLTGS